MLHTDGPANAADVAARIRTRHPGPIAFLQHDIRSMVMSGGRSDIRLRPDQRLYGPSVYDDATRIVVGHSFHPYTADLGTFPADSLPMFVRVVVSAYPLAPSAPPLRVQSDPTAEVSLVEAEGWFRAGMGDEWADYAYLRAADDAIPARAGVYRFGLILDVTGAPLLAPTNFEWSRVDGRPDRGIHKLAPSDANIVLRERILREGPFADPSAYLDPRTTPDGRWRIETSVRDADDDTAATFWMLTDLLRVRGGVHTRFVPVAFHLVGRSATLTYRLVGRPGIYDATVPIPSSTDLASTPSQGDHVGRYGYHPPVFPMTAGQWAHGLCAFWMEMVAYGRIGDVRPPWAR